MLCPHGAELTEAFQEAARERANARDYLLLAAEDSTESEDALAMSKVKYFAAFVALVTHKSACADCRFQSLSDDRVQFASV